MKDRIVRIMQEEQMTPIQFAKETGIQQASLSHILNGRNNPSLDIVRKIHQRFPRIDWDWLIEGTGTMYTAETPPRPLSLFDENGVNPSSAPNDCLHAKEIASNAPSNTAQEPVKETVKYIERPARKIVEIRIFFDDGTYETLTPSKQS